MKLKRINAFYTYKGYGEVITYLLFTKYNPMFISMKIKAKERFIQDLYYLNQSHTEFHEVYGLVSVSYPIDKLVELIISEKSKLEYYRNESKKNLYYLKQVLSHYTPKEQRQLMKYISSNGTYMPNEKLIERLQRDLYSMVNPQKQNRIRKFEINARKVIAGHIQQVKNQLNTELEVLTV